MPNDTTTPDAFEGSDPQVSRRDFVKVGVALAGLAYASAIGYPVYRYLSTPARRAASATAVTSVQLAVAELKPGSVLMFKFGSRPAMLIHHKDGTWAAFDAVCTHLGCTVEYLPDANHIHCACHGGVYDSATGGNVAGPPPKPLTKFNVEVKDGQAVVSRT